MSADGWLPIETAPRDREIIGISVNIYDDVTPPTVYGPWTMRWGGDRRKPDWEPSWNGGSVIRYMSDFGTDYEDLDLPPTHWQPVPHWRPLPDAPVPQPRSEGGSGDTHADV